MRIVCCVMCVLHAAGLQQVPTVAKKMMQSAAAAGLSTAVILSAPAAYASPTAAQVSLDNLPPSSIEVQISDLPVIGKLVSGTYTKVSDGSVKSPSVKIRSPADKVSAIKAFATSGHLEFDVSGFIATHLDVDVALTEPGVAQIRVKSPLIPSIPFKNAFSSPWKMVTDMGTGEVYYFNEASGKTQFDKPRI